ncbi:MAG: hypothetical protein H6662_06780 [Ardenticatenaceae bacterium]|nr:hypothetical protein [Anaerolineales bacterium]MCB8921270.1 hypothetical protein [Ardenticatenaceae bacterium]MCB8990636.1 hypothetical protein [Ardenticatenaceae bacterium]MCB9004343.1 hypothetical protein [Ardenticatenaceae bacterium]
MNKLSDILQVYTHNKQAVAQIVLNGYNIEKGGALGTTGAMRSFKIIRGDLWEEWAGQQNLLLVSNIGQESEVRIAALPVEEESFGLIEFI